MKHFSTKAIGSVIAEMNRQMKSGAQTAINIRSSGKPSLAKRSGSSARQFCMMNLAAINRERRAKRWCRLPPSLSRLSNTTIAIARPRQNLNKCSQRLRCRPSRRDVKKSVVVTGWTGLNCQRSALWSALTPKSFTRLGWQFSAIQPPEPQRAP